MDCECKLLLISIYTGRYSIQSEAEALKVDIMATNDNGGVCKTTGKHQRAPVVFELRAILVQSWCVPCAFFGLRFATTATTRRDEASRGQPTETNPRRRLASHFIRPQCDVLELWQYRFLVDVRQPSLDICNRAEMNNLQPDTLRSSHLF